MPPSGPGITPGKTTLVEPTSGNTGIALAFVAAARGYRLIVVMPENASIERRRMLRLMDAQVELTPQKLGMGGAIARAEKILADTPDSWMPAQFDNPSDPDIHAATTAEEIWADTDGRVDIVIGGVGTGGTLTGIGRALRPRRPVFPSSASNRPKARCSPATSPDRTAFRASGQVSSPRCSTWRRSTAW